MRRRLGGRAGYVMIEALAALAISGLVLAAVPLASGILFRNWEKATSGSDTLDRLASGLSVVRRELSMMRRERFADRDAAGPYAFLATSDTIGFVLPDASDGSEPGEFVVVIKVRPEANGNALVRGMAPFRPDMRNFNRLRLDDPVVLLSGPWKYRFQYAARRRDGLEWLDEWLDEQDLPVAIRLDVVDYTSEQRVIPPLVIPIRVDAEPGCVDERGGVCGI
ncbi:PulJ/GspJ family protein [Microbaculum marinisediminis]|uniref:Prepilin-type N-terminal cleavage/methylation domain-containing protein n=1 Tax=Microbaculum marinisediminis TaxID=2931392 RepID=A0AAW5R390_9HYPH|nr:hypothetical protein [Microbaculum sp. A6E488]MCT8974715.1 hypothetical protein [Microbaculum sp. A6E488]